jgi:hypothetical protein
MLTRANNHGRGGKINFAAVAGACIAFHLATLAQKPAQRQLATLNQVVSHCK